MTTENLFQLSESGALRLERRFTEKRMPGYCMAAAFDCLFTGTDVPLELYQANDNDDLTPEQLFSLIGQLAFGIESADSSIGQDYYFDTVEEFVDDLKELRNKATILLVTSDKVEEHAVGLKPVTEDPETWQLVGIDQVIPVVYSPGHPLQIHYIQEPDVLTTEQVWDFLCKNNPAEQTRQFAYVFPPEPQKT